MREERLIRSGSPTLSGNVLKVLAAAAMTLDHVGLVLLPGVQVLRLIGWIAFPIFAFMIAEGCAHTRSRARYFLHLLVLAAVCQTAYTVAMGQWFFCVPVSFSLAVLLILALEKWKNARGSGLVLWGLVFLGAVAAAWVLNQHITLDYGFWGLMMPVAASFFRKKGGKLDHNLVHVLAMALCMVPLALYLGPWQWWSFLALPFLKLYSGKRGRYKMKYFFYIFYPAHLLVIEGLAMLLSTW